MDRLTSCRDKFDLVLCDVVLPGGDGLQVPALNSVPKRPNSPSLILCVQLLESIRKDDSELAVIMISSHEDAAFLESSITLGAEAFLFKPIRMSDVKGIWQFAVRKRRNTARAVSLASLNSASLTTSAWHPRSDTPLH